MSATDTFSFEHNAIITLYFFDIHRQQLSQVKQLVIDRSVTVDVLSVFIKTVLITEGGAALSDRYSEMKALLEMDEGSEFSVHWTFAWSQEDRTHHVSTTEAPL